MLRELALFPLSQIVLPQGHMQLRIFEPRYQRLVKDACAGKRAFASALLNPYVASDHPDRIFALATAVTVTDFTQLEDGLLGITICGVERVQIVRRWQEEDGLHVGMVQTLPDWPVSIAATSASDLTGGITTSVCAKSATGSLVFATRLAQQQLAGPALD